MEKIDVIWQNMLSVSDTYSKIESAQCHPIAIGVIIQTEGWSRILRVQIDGDEASQNKLDYVCGRIDPLLQEIEKRIDRKLTMQETLAQVRDLFAIFKIVEIAK